MKRRLHIREGPRPAARPTQAWAVEGARLAETADPRGAARVASRHAPRPPRPPVRRSRKPLETGSRPIPLPPSTTRPRRFPHLPPPRRRCSLLILKMQSETPA
jgi:hypothetical protein